MRNIIILFSFFLSIQSFSQTQNFQEKYQIRVVKTDTPLKIDGELNEAIWEKTIPVGDFWEKFPNDKIKAKLNTTVKAAFDDKYIYFAMTAYDSTNRYIAPSLKRDGFIRGTDGIAIVLDPVNKKTNGFSLAIDNAELKKQLGEKLACQCGFHFGRSVDCNHDDLDHHAGTCTSI